MDIGVTAFLYSDHNFELAYKLRGVCKSQGVNLLNVFSLKEFLLKSRDLSFSILFVDANSFDLNKDTIDMIVFRDGRQRTAIALLYNYRSGVCERQKNVLDNKDVFKIGYNNFEDAVENISKILNLNRSGQLPEDMSDEIFKYLQDLKISPKHVGFDYIKDIVTYYLNISGHIKNLHTDMYALLAAKHDTTVYNVERSIRMAINCAWNKNGLQIIFETKPTNKLFLATIVIKLKCMASKRGAEIY